MIDPHAARDSIVAAGARLGARGLIVASEGNLSMRLGSTILITPSGRRKDELVAADILEAALDPADGSAGEVDDTQPRPSSDIAIHRAIYAARPDVCAIAHAHLAASLALTIVGSLPNPGSLPETMLFLPRLPFVRFASPGSPELAAAVMEALTDRGSGGETPCADAILLERHGAIAVGADLVTAVDLLDLVDLLCRVHRDEVLLRAALRDRGGN